MNKEIKEIKSNEEFSVILKSSSSLKYNADKIKSLIDSVSKNYVNVGYILNQIKKEDLILCGYKDIYEYAEECFNFKSTSVKNMMSIAKKFCVDNEYYFSLKEEYKNFSYSQLTEMLSVSDSNLIEFKEDMTIKEMKYLKKMQLANNYLVTAFENELKYFDPTIDTKKITKIENNSSNMSVMDNLINMSFLDEYKELGGIKILSSIIDDNGNRIEKKYLVSYKNLKGLKFSIKLQCYLNSINEFKIYVDIESINSGYGYYYYQKYLDIKDVDLNGYYKRLKEFLVMKIKEDKKTPYLSQREKIVKIVEVNKPIAINKLKDNKIKKIEEITYEKIIKNDELKNVEFSDEYCPKPYYHLFNNLYLNPSFGLVTKEDNKFKSFQDVKKILSENEELLDYYIEFIKNTLFKDEPKEVVTIQGDSLIIDVDLQDQLIDELSEDSDFYGVEDYEDLDYE